jgi:hypothetical protein
VIAGPIASDAPPDALGKQPDRQLRAKWCAWPECFVFTPHPARYIARDFVPFAPDVRDQARQRATRVDSLHMGEDEYSIMELDATPILESKLAMLAAAPVFAPDQTPLTLPIPFDNGLELVGYEVNAPAPDAAYSVNTYWRVTDRIAPPTTIFVHLLDAHGNIQAQHDGFGAALTTLEPGDVVIQHHPLPSDIPPGVYRLQMGLYQPVTLDRFSAHPAGVSAIDRVLLPEVVIGAP